MNGDLRLLRRRWWGAWSLLATAVLCLFLLVPAALEETRWVSPQSLRSTLIPIALCIVLGLVCYAPWTFFVLVRVLGALVCAIFVVYLVEEAVRGRWVSDGTKSPCALNAARGLIEFGPAGGFIAMLKRPSLCPYDEKGRARPFEMFQSLVVRDLHGTGAATWPARVRAAVDALPISKRDKRRLEVLDAADGTVEVRCRVPIGPDGVALLARIRAALEEQGVSSQRGSAVPAPTTFRSLFDQAFAHKRA